MDPSLAPKGRARSWGTRHNVLSPVVPQICGCPAALRKRTISAMKRLVLIFALLVSVSVCLHSSEARRDGNWWKSQTRALKLDYMVGFFDGMRLGYNFSYWEFAQDDAAHGNADCVSKVGKSYNSLNDKYFSNVTNDQIVDGLDVFYSDYRNRRIKIADAVWLVVNEMAGTPRKELDKLIESWRKRLCGLKKVPCPVPRGRGRFGPAHRAFSTHDLWPSVPTRSPPLR